MFKPNTSYVTPYGKNSSECHYCYQSDIGRISYGIDAKQLTVDDYQALCDTGWRRSGSYIYRPDNVNESTCCPQYTIRLDVCRFKQTKDNKQVYNRFENYIKYDDLHAKSEIKSTSSSRTTTTSTLTTNTTTTPTPTSTTSTTTNNNNNDILNQLNLYLKQYFNDSLIGIDEQSKQHVLNHLLVRCNTPKFQKLVGGAQYSCSVAPLLVHKQRIEETSSSSFDKFIENSIIQRLKEQPDLSSLIKDIFLKDNHINIHLTTTTSSSTTKQKHSNNNNSNSIPKSIEPKHKLEITIRRAEYTEEVFQLYCKYQRIVHKEVEPKKPEGFTRFLVDSPLVFVPYSKEGYYSKRENRIIEIPETGFGSFHQYYRIDGKLAALGIVDILPHCLSSVYMLYDPDFQFLSIGKLTALKEIEYIQNQLSKQASQLHYYYMGYYIHSCQKMRYKGKFKPSELLCNQSYQWVDLEKAVSKISDEKPYSAFVDDAPTTSFSQRYPNAVDSIKIFDGKGQEYRLSSFNASFANRLRGLLTNYLDNVGPGLASNIFHLKTSKFYVKGQTYCFRGIIASDMDILINLRKN
ncbi:arginyltransferase [Heterostelium album PN500]|uniref:Arginyl-tRNA--protein transferase 1 n=1 Tax=Heterostelium pallidum (strain ATCC 26659 / Pp 5 / PN500) TaxID=670386 RepID=D3B381_HETP5|nr:arginyltransferase [Heterostelium album PN500]EFA83779.1 arginyltransferase [Heterostelium album PN500]|eukprot:XP_020435896.1 arginyltransferase [Heterostelium album PN500]